MSQPQYEPQPGDQAPAAQFNGQYLPPHPGVSLSQTSMILGILSLFVVGVILGPIAIMKGNEAERVYGVPATVGKVTGMIGLIFGALQVLAIVGYFLLILFIIPFSIYGSGM
ncbi:hypothetical protein [Glutamicibacter arilaitensis]|uniref:hypothetical protein n=1 Tax=Glutamicibacter arilaitensis TaxID=256701 RepID=UPI00384A9B46